MEQAMPWCFFPNGYWDRSIGPGATFLKTNTNRQTAHQPPSNFLQRLPNRLLNEQALRRASHMSACRPDRVLHSQLAVSCGAD